MLSAQPVNKQYRVGLVLPFHSSGTQSTLSEAMLDYYEGFKMAAQYLEAEGLNLKLYVFDSEKDSFEFNRILKHPDLKTMDIIVGPVYAESMSAMEDFCNKYNILLVSPLKYFVPKTDFKNVINFFAPDSLRLSSIAEKCAKKYPKHKIYIVQDKSKNSIAEALIIRKKLKAMQMPFVRTTTLTDGKLNPIPSHLDSVILISTISNKETKSALLTAIKKKNESYLFAHLDWNEKIGSTFEMDEPQTIYPEVNFVSYHDSFAIHFREQFFELYSGEPSKYAYIGYDQATYLCYGMMTFGRGFYTHLPDAEFRGLINVIKLYPSSNSMVNLGLNYLQIIEEERVELER
ncbi:MAG: hypothetical protein KG003_07180 [Bacteroidetes bacterium]|nr:hypothetical protein [Bacteroidota bacterium]